jgi:hypothetical protein
MTITYADKMIITSRFDTCGKFWKTFPSTAPYYQGISDLRVNIKDPYACAMAFGSRPGYPNWNVECDVNNDLKIDVKDYYAIAQNYGWIALNPLGG